MTAGEAEAIVVLGPCSATDADLARLLDRSIPNSAVTAWAGAYTIIRATRPGTVTIWTDPAGACPIYTTRDEDGALVWGSSSRALAALADGRVDERWLATFLTDPYTGAAGRSAFTGVALVPPGHRLTVTGGRVSDLTPVWAPTPLRVPEAVERLRSTLAAGVRVRVAGSTPAADLSGLDSSTVAVLAARAGPVTAVTLHPAGVTTGGDVDHARVTTAANPNLRHILLPLEDHHLPYTELDALPATDEPAPSSSTWAMLSAQLQMLAGIGVNCHLVNVDASSSGSFTS